MTINIQINFSSGIGDFYTYFCEIYFSSKQLKELGHDVHLYFNSKRKIDFLNLFEPKYYEYFDQIFLIENGKTLNDFENYKIKYPHEKWPAGVHCWEMFVPEEFNDDYKKYFVNLSHPGLLNYEDLSNFPKLSEEIIKNTENFRIDNGLNNFSVIHFREWDDIGDAYNVRILHPDIQDEEFQVRHKTLKSAFSIDKNTMNKIKDICDNNQIVFVCSNSMRVKRYIKEHFTNVFLYDDDILKTTKRDYSDEEYWNFCLIEFCLISMAEKINIFTNYNWISNFIVYGVLNNKTGVVNPYKDNSFVQNYGSFMDLA
jgi:hypothetical protein